MAQKDQASLNQTKTTGSASLLRISMSCRIFPHVSTGILDACTLRFKDARMEADFSKVRVQKASVLLGRMSLLLCIPAAFEFFPWAYHWSKDHTQSSRALIAPLVFLACAILLMIILRILGNRKKLAKVRGAVLRRLEMIVVVLVVVCMVCTPLMHPWYRVHFLADEGTQSDPEGSDARLHLSLICVLVTPHFVLPLRWCVLWPVHLSCIVVYSICLLLLGGYERSTLFSLSGVFLFTYMLYVTMLAKRRAEVDERLLFVSKAYPEKRDSQTSGSKHNGLDSSKTLSPVCSSDTELLKEDSAKDASWQEWRTRLQTLGEFQKSKEVLQAPLPSPFNRMKEESPIKFGKDQQNSEPNSAPAVLAQSFMKQVAVCEASSGDCLPPDAVVWVEEKAMPMPLLDVQPGDKVMCYDRLSMCMKYAKVTSKKVQDSEVTWVTLVLADGSSMLMTADHPVHRDSGKESQKKHAIKAAKLRPGKDSIMVLKMVPIYVEKVLPMASKEPETPHTRVTLSVQHEERHSIFVGAPGQNPCIAVGSAGVDALSCRSSELDSVHEKITVKNTFVHTHEPRADEISTLRRSNSAPCLQTGNTDDDAAVVLDVVPSTPAQPMELQLAAWQLSSDQGTSDYSNSMSACTVSGDGTTNIVMPELDGQPCGVAKVLQVKQNGLASSGSAMHVQGECRACVFHSKGQHKPGMCTMGSLCNFCHEEHAYKKKRGNGRGNGRSPL